MRDWYTCTETTHVWVGFDTYSGSQKSPELLTQQHQKRHPLTRHGPSSSLGEHPLEFVCLRSNYPASCAQKDLYELILYHLACLYPPSYVISLKGLWRATHFSVYSADPNKRKNPWWNAALCLFLPGPRGSHCFWRLCRSRQQHLPCECGASPFRAEMPFNKTWGIWVNECSMWWTSSQQWISPKSLWWWPFSLLAGMIS